VLHARPWPSQLAAQLPPRDPLFVAQAAVQHCALLVHGVPVPPQCPLSPGGPVSGGPESGGPVSGQQSGSGPQLSVQLPVQPVDTQQTSADVQTAPVAQEQGSGTPQLSATETLHAFPQRLVGVQHMLLVLHSSPAWQVPLHWICWPQLSRTVTPPQRPAHASFVGMQHRS
jgi:hypothetical protein